MSKILALDTSTEACSCALNIDGQVSETFLHVPREHTHRLLPAISDMMKSQGLAFKDLDAVAVGRGPGSFTGLRIGIGAAQGIALGADIPIIGISTLKSMAFEKVSNEIEYVFSCMDARIAEVYYSFYRFDGKQLIELGHEHLAAPENIQLPADLRTITGIYAVGNGMNFLQQMPAGLRAVISALDEKALPRAGNIAMLAAENFSAGLYTTDGMLEPVYLRDKVTQ